MKHFNFRYLALFLGFSFFIACKKDDATPTPPPPPKETAEEKLFKNIQGRWDMLPTSTKSQDAPDPAISSVVFSADSTVLVIIDERHAQKATFNVKDSVSIDLTGAEAGQTATISDIKFTNDGISFSYTFGEITGSFTASKVEYLTIDTEDKAILGSWARDVDGEGSQVWTFYSAGFLTISNGYEYSWSASWSFHPEEDNAIIVDNGFEGDFLRIKELTSAALTIEEIFIDEDGEESKGSEYSFSRD